MGGRKWFSPEQIIGKLREAGCSKSKGSSIKKSARLSMATADKTFLPEVDTTLFTCHDNSDLSLDCKNRVQKSVGLATTVDAKTIRSPSRIIGLANILSLPFRERTLTIRLSRTSSFELDSASPTNAICLAFG